MSGSNQIERAKGDSLSAVIRQIAGLMRYSFKNPCVSLQLLRSRVDFFLHRKLTHACVDPHGYRIDSPEKLFTWWASFIDKQLVHPVWTVPLAAVRAPQIIDVGANAGVFTHLVLTINPSARITAVEPQPGLVRLIQNYASQRGRDVRCVTTACSDHDGQATLFLDNDGDVRASLDPMFASHTQQLSVPVTTVDAIAPKGEIFMLKIDAEGHDIEVLKGATAVLRRTRFVLIECHKPEMLAQAKALLDGLCCQQVGSHDFLFFPGPGAGNVQTKDGGKP